MKKIPTMFERDWDGNPSRVLDQPAEGCEWVFAGEGTATRKYDGTACLIEGRTLFKRHAIKLEQDPPEGFREVARERNPKSGAIKIIGWVPVGDGPEDRWAREAFSEVENAAETATVRDGTYELLGPKVQGNPEGADHHVLLYHGDALTYPDAPRTFEGLRSFFENEGLDVEGLVFHHPDGRMAKIKKRDFGIKRAPSRSAVSVN